MQKKHLILLFFYFITIAVWAQSPVQWKVEKKGNLKQGNEVTLTFTATIPEGYFIYSFPAPNNDWATKFAPTITFRRQVKSIKAGNLAQQDAYQVHHSEKAEVRYAQKEMKLQQNIFILAETPSLAGQLQYTYFDANGKIEKGSYSFEVKE